MNKKKEKRSKRVMSWKCGKSIIISFMRKILNRIDSLTGRRLTLNVRKQCCLEDNNVHEVKEYEYFKKNTHSLNI
jgi:hypothetical protein